LGSLVLTQEEETTTTQQIIRFTQRQHYAKFLSTLFQHPRFMQMFSSFNLTFLFEITQTNSSSSSQNVVLFRSRETLIHLNFSRIASPKLELIIIRDSIKQIASFDVDVDWGLQTFSFCIDEHNIKLTLNNARHQVSFLPLHEDYLEFFQSDFIEMKTQAFPFDDHHNLLRVVVHRVYLNKHRLALSNGTSRQYETILSMYEEKTLDDESEEDDEEKEKVITTRFDGNGSGKQVNKLLITTQTIFSNTWNHPTPILIVATISVMFIFALIALLSIIINIYVRRRRERGRGSVCSNSIQTTQTSNSSASSLSELTTRITQLQLQQQHQQNGHYFQYDSLKCDSTTKRTSALNSMSK